MKFRELLTEGKNKLEAAGCPEAPADARALLFHVFHLTLGSYAARSEDEAPKEGEESYLAAINERMSRRPLGYIIGEAPFYGRDFYVNEDVLIPRFDTEVLVFEALSLMHEGDRVLDLCTGSGCIPVTLALEGPAGCRIDALDISKGALAVAEKNAARHRAAVNFILSDLFENISGRYAIITANPPYIPSGVIGTLMPEVRDHEPRIALDGSSDGLCFYVRIAAEAKDHLEAGGHLVMEIGYDQGEAVSRILREAGYHDVRVVKDLAGLDRVVCGAF